MLAGAFGLLASGALLLTATPAFAHHPEITAVASCGDNGFVIDFTSTAWAGFGDPGDRDNADVRVSAIVNGGAPVEVAQGAYNAGNGYSFSGQFNLPATTTSLEVTATAVANWGNGADGGQTTTTGPISLPTDCEEPPPPPPPGDDGCTPGYWKNHLGSWQVYSPSDATGSVFSGANAYGLGSNTLLDSLQNSGGTGTTGAARFLLRAGTAALLNASHSDVDYTRSAADVIASVNAALNSGDRATILQLANALDADNNLGCPIS